MVCLAEYGGVVDAAGNSRSGAQLANTIVIADRILEQILAGFSDSLFPRRLAGGCAGSQAECKAQDQSQAYLVQHVLLQRRFENKNPAGVKQPNGFTDAKIE